LLGLGVAVEVVGGQARFHEVRARRFAEFAHGNRKLILVIGFAGSH
jgi:hypothetical protein